jgi:hypothetical protein
MESTILASSRKPPNPQFLDFNFQFERVKEEGTEWKRRGSERPCREGIKAMPILWDNNGTKRV